MVSGRVSRDPQANGGARRKTSESWIMHRREGCPTLDGKSGVRHTCASVDDIDVCDAVNAIFQPLMHSKSHRFCDDTHSSVMNGIESRVHILLHLID